MIGDMSQVSSAEVHVSWDEVVDLSVTLGQDIVAAVEAEEVPPIDKILLIPRGGLHIVNILARQLHLSGDRVVSLAISKYQLDDPARQDASFKVGQTPSINDIYDQHILIADEIYDTGDTIVEAIACLEGLGAQTVTTASLFYKPGQNRHSIQPDFHGPVTNGWVHFPWEVLDAPTA